jgi:eukaryotic-like serine/threonine-protein kinase
MARKENSYPIGERLPGTKYVVVRKLGRGGMGVVLEVVKEPGIRGVVKIIHPFLAEEPEFRQRFFDEVRILAKLDHPNIVKVTDFDRLADGTPYFAMELLRGSTIRQVLRATGVIHPTHLYQIMRGLLEGLEYVHTHNPPIVHRDIKCENVFIHAPEFGDPCVKVIDFGVAWGASGVDDGGFVGTRRYAAPEQFRGEPVTFKADIYSAGLLLYEGLAGRGPFDDVPLIPADEGNRMKAFARAHMSYLPPSIRRFAPWVPESLDGLLQSALAKEPEKRPESAYAFASKLYVLQFMKDAPFGNTTVQNLNTMAQLSAVAEEAQESGRAPSARREEPPSSDDGPPSQSDTVLLEGPMPWLEDRAREERMEAAPSSGPTVIVPESVVMQPAAVASPNRASRPAMAAAMSPQQPELNRFAQPGRPRSFAEAERAAAQARGTGSAGAPVQGMSTLASAVSPAAGAGAGQPDARKKLEQVVQWDAAALARAGETERRRPTDPGRSKPSSGLGRLPVIVIAVAIPMIAAVALVIFLLARTTSSKPAPAATASGGSPSAKSTAPVPLPPEDPTSPSSSPAAPTASAPHDPGRR